MLRLSRNVKRSLKLLAGAYLTFSIISLIKGSISFNHHSSVIVVEDVNVVERALENIEFSEPETFCSPYKSGIGYSERIIFLDASGELCLTPRDICGIESAARANPEMTIDIFLHSGDNPAKKPASTKSRKARSCSMTESLSEWFPNNVRFHREDLYQHFMDSKFKSLLDDEGMLNSTFSFIHFTDALKLILLKKYGGIYLDTSFLTLRSLHCLNNTMTFVSADGGYQHLSNGVMALEKDHSFLGFTIRYQVAKYRPDWKGALGGAGMGDSFHMFCPNQNISAGHHVCYKDTAIDLLPPKLFFPIRRKYIPVLFSNSYQNYLHLKKDLLKDSFTVYIFGSQWGLPVHPKSLYASLAMKYCPKTWKKSSELETGF